MKKMLYITGLLLSGWGVVMAQQGQLINVKVINDEVKKNGREVNVRMTLDISDLKVGTQKSVRLTPVIVSKTGHQTRELESVMIDGKTRSRVHKRTKVLTGTSITDDAFEVVRRKNGKNQQVEYTVAIPYETWMAQSRLVLREEIIGCLECEESSEESPVRNTFLQLFRPNWTIPFVRPQKEAVKVRDEVRVARLNFRQDSHKIDPRFKNNQAELDSVFHSIAMVKDNKDLTITGIYITGYASPEGTMAYNERLSQRRAESFAQYVQKNTDVTSTLWHVNWKGEDWEGLRKEVERHPKLLKIDEVLKIIDECEGNQDICEEKIKALVPPEIYQRLLNEMYGPLRRNEYRIEYNVRNFNLEEAKTQIKTRPDLLSVEEIYTVAESYGKGTPQYNEALLTAARIYPDCVAAVVNGACLELEHGNVGAAITLLERSKVIGEVEVLNALGVAYARNQQYDKAKKTLSDAARSGSHDAKINLKQLAGVVADL